MADNKSYLAFLEFGQRRSVLIYALLCFVFVGCDRSNTPSDELEASKDLAKEIADLNWSQLENSFDQILSEAHIKTSNSSWLNEQGEAIASYTSSYQIDPNADGQKFLLLHSDSSAIDEGFDWPKQRGALRWLDSNPYSEIRLDSSVFKSARVIEKYAFAAASSPDQRFRNHKLEGRVGQDIIFDQIEIKSKSTSKIIDSVDYVRVQSGLLFKEESVVSIRLDNDQRSSIPVSFSVDSKVNPILLDPLHVKTEVSYKALSNPDN